MPAGFRAEQVQVAGRSMDYARTSDEQDPKVHVFHFSPDCGGTVFYTEPDEADLMVVMVGAFADPAFPPPTESGYGARRHRWFDLPRASSATRCGHRFSRSTRRASTPRSRIAGGAGRGTS